MSKTTKSASKSSNKAVKAESKKVGRPPAADRVEKNGAVQPKEGTDCRKVWDLATKIGPDRAAVLEAAGKANINPATASTQFARWRQFNGITGRTAKPQAPKAPKGKKDAGSKAVAAVKDSKAPKAPAAPVPPAPVAPVPPAPAA